MKNVNRTFLFLTIFFWNFSIAQNNDKSGEIKYKVEIVDFGEIKNLEKESDKRMIMSIKNELDKKSFVLVFNKSESLFTPILSPLEVGEEKLISKLANTLSGANKKYYRNNKTKEKLKEIEYLGETFLVSQKIEDNWILTKEKSIILGYICYRAYKEVKTYNSKLREYRTFTPEVWFCPDLPFSFGPIGLDGLPGLILKATFNGKITYLADKIKLQSEVIKITHNFKGEKISEEDFRKKIENF